MPSHKLKLHKIGSENLPSRQVLMKCKYLNPGSTGHSLNKQTSDAQCSIFARSVLIIFKVRKKVFKWMKQYNIRKFRFNLFGNTVSKWLTPSCFFVLQDGFCLFVNSKFRDEMSGGRCQRCKMSFSWYHFGVSGDEARPKHATTGRGQTQLRSNLTWDVWDELTCPSPPASSEWPLVWCLGECLGDMVTWGVLLILSCSGRGQTPETGQGVPWVRGRTSLPSVNVAQYHRGFAGRVGI